MSNRGNAFTNFLFKFGTYSLYFIKLGLMSGMETYWKAMDKMLDGFSFVRIFLDDIIIISNTTDEHLKHFVEVLERMPRYKRKKTFTICGLDQA